MPAIREQLKRNAVALISLTIAVSSLAYNTWRNEQSEFNRNIRTAGIELLIKLGELDRTILQLEWGDIEADSNEAKILHRSGWGYVLTIRDLGTITNDPAEQSCHELFDSWNRYADELGTDPNNRQPFNTISDSIDTVRADVLYVLENLD